MRDARPVGDAVTPEEQAVLDAAEKWKDGVGDSECVSWARPLQLAVAALRESRKPKLRYYVAREGCRSTIVDRECERHGYVLKVWARRDDGHGLTDHGPEVEREAERIVAALNAQESK